jgi:hypothetical protein
MPKNSGESLKTVRLAPKPQPSRPIKHGWVPSGAKTVANAMGANKRFDAITPSPKKKGPAGDGKVDPRQMRY